MPTTVDFPTLVKQALELFGDVFDNEPARRHFAEYLTGLMVAEHKNISAINRLFAVTTDQSCLNRWLVEASWDAAVLWPDPLVVGALSLRVLRLGLTCLAWHAASANIIATAIARDNEACFGSSERLRGKNGSNMSSRTRCGRIERSVPQPRDHYVLR